MTDWIREKLNLLPAKPGVYLMKDADGRVLYVGKAKVLRNRVRSYFTGSHDRKTQTLVSRIADFEYIVTDTVVEALLLECNLIKQYSPPYNIMLRDDKAYPYIKITREAHPRLEIARRIQDDGAKYFGPYPNATSAAETKKLLERLYPLRKCKRLKKKVCLYYHIGQCLAPCEFEVPPEQYERITKEIADFLQGGHRQVRQALWEKMEQEAEALRFERAKELRDLIAHIERVMEEQKITLQDRIDRDVFGFAAKRGWLCVQVFHVRQGKLIERSVDVFRHHGEAAEDFMSYVEQFYFTQHDVPQEILLPQGVADEALAAWLPARCQKPQRGQKRQLVDLACENARIALEERLQLMDRRMDQTFGAILELGEVLGIPAPSRIEAFDNSHLHGADPVAAMVVFIDGRPARQEYRKYKIRSGQGADDYASMREVIRRRYTRVLREKLPLPDLIVIDGGKGQLRAALDVLENELDLDIPVCGLAKDDRHKTSQLFFRDEEWPVGLDQNSQAFHLLERIQEEVHRFAVEFHRRTRAKTGLASVLDEVPGVGPARRKKLLQHFGSLAAMEQADLDAFRAIGIGSQLALAIQAHLRARAGRPSS
ncbi:UvrABC system protein C [Alicyclobacillus cellulosilyticus]|uniref:UvrABC system protein C n=1 Tax=Alicyclobacillus cellulosilyticus TaxID=1003997 RepID=A0A917NGP0_9BACL|nr:excinuclease ABC subunit UvrC [Alicyclobacillus cellulosilyticus]GGI96434.1 UvrABC system protein C [Alicyclobacillus cellulosilyticus]